MGKFKLSSGAQFQGVDSYALKSKESFSGLNNVVARVAMVFVKPFNSYEV